MQVIILAGGSGTRLREMTEFIPKPLIPIGPYPMITHIMKLYSHYGYRNFVLSLGFKQEEFKQYFCNYDAINNDITISTGHPLSINYHNTIDYGWSVTLCDTGLNTMKGARLKRVERYIEGDTFMVTYGDGIGNINIPLLLDYHKSHGKLVTITGVHPAPRFGEVFHSNGHVTSFSEKPYDQNCLVNGGFMVMNRGIFDYLTLDEWCDLEVGMMDLLAAKGELMVYPHKGYWACMDSLKDVEALQQEWNTGRARWIV